MCQNSDGDNSVIFSKLIYCVVLLYCHLYFTCIILDPVFSLFDSGMFVWFQVSDACSDIFKPVTQLLTSIKGSGKTEQPIDKLDCWDLVFTSP